MNILFAVDENYLAPLYTLINSIVCNNKVKINFYLLYSDISKESLDKLKLYIERKGNTLKPILVNTNIFDNAYLISYITKVSFYRLLVSDLIPNDVDRILYLDADILVNGSLKDIYNADFEGKLIGAVADNPYLQKNKDKYEGRLNINPNHIYFNAGVILFNLKLIRYNTDKNEYKIFLNNIIGKNLLHGDQDILNIYFENKIKYFPEKYNYRPRFYYKFKIFNPVIIHYYGCEKPWQKEYCHEYKFIYYKYAEDRIEDKATSLETFKYHLKLLFRKSKTLVKIMLFKLNVIREI